MATTGYYLNQFVTKNLSGAVADTTSTTGITLDSVTGLDTTKPGVAALTWNDPLDEDSVEWITYTSINGSSQFVGVTRGDEGGTARTHENNAVVAFPISESHINNLATALSIGGSATNLCEGVLDEDDMATDSATKVPTQQSVKAFTETFAIEFVIDGGGAAITTGDKGDIEVPVDCTITRCTLLADQSGSIAVDIWKDTYANFPPANADSITASAVPTISTATKDQDSTLTGWTTSLSAGDILSFNVDSCTTITRCTVSLKVTRT